MKRKKMRKDNFQAVTVAALAALLLLGLPGMAGAQCTYATAGADTDCDGLPDTVEQAGISLCGTLLDAEGNSTIPTLTAIGPCTAGADRATCLDYQSPDVFVIYNPLSSGSLLPTGELLHYVSGLQADGGLEVAVHLLQQASTYRLVWPDAADSLCDPAYTLPAEYQLAVSMAESDAAFTAPTRKNSAVILGSMTQGNGNGPNNGTVHTERIRAFIEYVCDGASSCTDSYGNSGDALRDNYMWYVANHELGHTLDLGPTYSAEYNGNHFPPDMVDPVIMEQSAVYVVSKGKNPSVTFYFPGKFHPQSQLSVDIHGH